MNTKTPLSPMNAKHPQGALDLWARGPWMFLDIGLKFARAWQDTWLKQMRLLPAMAQPVTKLSEPSLPEQIAVRQANKLPHLGCLQGVEVVGGPKATESVSPAKSAVKPAIKSAAAPKKPVPVKAVVQKTGKAAPKKSAQKISKEVVKSAPVASKVAAKKPAQRAAVKPVQPKAAAKAVKSVPVVTAAVDSATLPPPSVTSMLAMQARSLSKVVGKKPEAAAAKKKPASKKA